jgi:hypothetical protein
MPAEIWSYLQVGTKIRIGGCFWGEYFIVIRIYRYDLAPDRPPCLLLPGRIFLLEFVIQLSQLDYKSFLISLKERFFHISHYHGRVHIGRWQIGYLNT